MRLFPLTLHCPKARVINQKDPHQYDLVESQFNFFHLVDPIPKGQGAVSFHAQDAVSLCKTHVLDVGQLRFVLVNVRNYFLDPQIYNKITLPSLITNTRCFKCALSF